MSGLEMKTAVEVEEFADELSDEALDRAEGWMCSDGGTYILGIFSPALAISRGGFRFQRNLKPPLGKCF